MSEIHTWQVTVSEGQGQIEVCQWIVDNGGWDNLSFSAVSSLVSHFVNQTELGDEYNNVVPNFYSTMGTVLYWIGNKDMGNLWTGCDF